MLQSGKYDFQEPFAIQDNIEFNRSYCPSCGCGEFEKAFIKTIGIHNPNSGFETNCETNYESRCFHLDREAEAIIHIGNLEHCKQCGTVRVNFNPKE